MITTVALSFKQKVARAFSRQATNYNGHADIQQTVASTLAKVIAGSSNDLPVGDILEIGCGTGFLSYYLTTIFPNRHLLISDISKKMLEQCQLHLTNLDDFSPEFIHFHQIDGEHLGSHQQTFAAIASSFTFQWFENIESSLTSLLHTLSPGGFLFFAVPITGSFPEWHELCSQNNLSFTFNNLPDKEIFYTIAQAYNAELMILEERFSKSFQNIFAVLHYIKHLGASTRQDNKLLSLSSLRKLQHQHNTNKKITLTYRILYGYLKK